MAKMLVERACRRGKLLVILACVAVACLAATPVAACRYTVRDVAFVELSDMPYRGFLFLDGTEPAEVQAAQDLAETHLSSSNVRWQVMTPGADRTEDVEKLLEQSDTWSMPAAAAFAPDGRVFQLQLDAAANGLPAAFKKAMTEFVQSPLRGKVLDQLPLVHSVAILVEGDDAVENRRAERIARASIAEIEAGLADLPKPIENPPQLIVLSQADAQTEAALLWSLGIDVENSPQVTRIAAVFGRGRLLGKVMEGQDISQRKLTRTLAVAGLDCECGLDRSWMRTPMFPHVWTASREDTAAQALEFDPGHPLVKVEISRILNRGPNQPPGTQNESPGLAEVDPLLPGLQIIDLDFADDDAPAVESGKEVVAEVEELPAMQDSHAPKASDPSPEERSVLDIITLSMLGIVVVGLLGGAAILFSGKRVGS